MILACHNLNKSFGERIIVKDGSFHIEDREKVAFVGVNGAGKSTLMNVLTGVYRRANRQREYCSYKRENNWLSCTAAKSNQWK